MHGKGSNLILFSDIFLEEGKYWTPIRKKLSPNICDSYKAKKQSPNL
jgi:hypothetical protein